MTSIMKRLKTATGLAALLSLFAAVQVAHATGTTAGTSVSNTATVNYNVGGVAQAPITSAPTSFVVDNKIDLTVAEVGAAATTVVPGQTAAVLTFTVSNTGNSPEGYQLSASNQSGTTLFGRVDNVDFAGLTVFVDSNANGTYDAGVDTASNINTLAKDATVTVFVVVNVPNGAANAQVANVRLQARAAVPLTNGATLETPTAGGDTAGSVDIVFADTGRDATETADDQYFVQSAALAISKSSTVISDPLNGTTQPLAIPGAVIEYVVTISNTGAATAGGISVSDSLNANLTFVQGAYTGGTDVEVQIGATTTRYIAEQGADSNLDGVNRAGQTLTVNPTTAISVTAGQTALVRFRATIN
jgi:uncharacterized repeat protein (TIGR01451 family)